MPTIVLPSAEMAEAVVVECPDGKPDRMSRPSSADQRNALVTPSTLVLPTTTLPSGVTSTARLNSLVSGINDNPSSCVQIAARVLLTFPPEQSRTVKPAIVRPSSEIPRILP